MNAPLLPERASVAIASALFDALTTGNIVDLKRRVELCKQSGIWDAIRGKNRFTANMLDAIEDAILCKEAQPAQAREFDRQRQFKAEAL